MSHVTGIGGLFFRSRDPDALSAWYRDMLDVGAGCVADGEGEPDQWTWKTAGGPVVFAPFGENDNYFSPERRWMLNLRIRDLDGLVARLRAAGIDIVTKAEWDDPAVGRFARIHDPEGNPIELWEPPSTA